MSTADDRGALPIVRRLKAGWAHILEGAVLALEARLSGVVEDHDVRHLLWLRGQLSDDLIDLAVINTGPEAFRRREGIAVIPLALLGP